MKFNEENAIEIVKKHNLSEKILKVWKNRNSIPDKYFQENFQKYEKLSKAEQLQQRRIVAVLNSGNLYLNVISQLCDIRVNKLTDVVKGKSSLSVRELTAVKSELKKIKIEIKEAFQSYSERKLKIILNHPVLKYSSLLKNISRNEGIEQVSRFRKGKHPDPITIWSKIKDTYVIFAMQL